MASLLAEINRQLSIKGFTFVLAKSVLLMLVLFEPGATTRTKEEKPTQLRHSVDSRASVRGSEVTLCMGQARYFGLARNRIRFGVMCLAYNLRRGANIKKSCETSHYSCA
jgi:hypothetical protein